MTEMHARPAELVAAFRTLPPGGSLVIMDDHDPEPLQAQMNAEFPRSFSWEYVERGPRTWKVRITRTCCGCSG
jgi:uncharacterized protein (DUF2249 family)